MTIELSPVDKLLKRTPKAASDMEKTTPPQDNAENSTPYAPNIALNFGEQIKRWQLRLVAAIGVILQFGTFLAESFITHYHTLKLKKEDSPISSAAFELTVTGTLVLVI